LHYPLRLPLPLALVPLPRALVGFGLYPMVVIAIESQYLS
jgi:hypothetical protein